MSNWTLYEGDCLEVMCQLPDNSVDAVVTDPPYNIGIAHWDSFPDAKSFLGWFEEWTEEAFRLLKPTGTLTVFTAQQFVADIEILLRSKWRLINRCIWTYENGQRQATRRYSMGYVPFLFLAKSDGYFFNLDAARDGVVWKGQRTKRQKNGTITVTTPHPLGRRPLDVFACPRMTGSARNGHPSPKPLELMRRIVRPLAPPGGIILDPFAGSGTTLLAAVQEGFLAIGIEREPEYCEIIRKRMATVQQPLPLEK